MDSMMWPYQNQSLFITCDLIMGNMVFSSKYFKLKYHRKKQANKQK